MEVDCTDTNRMKRAAEWFYSNVFQEEAIRPRATQPEQRLPAPLRAARALEGGSPACWQSRESVFVKQAKLLAAYEDDYAYDRPVQRYYPTYQSLTDPELRGYFSWRTKLRKGDVQKTSLTFAFLYIYELLNQVGVSNPMDGYRKLRAFGDAYGALDGGILPYLGKWLVDYAVYYGLDAELLSDSPQVLFDRSVTVLENIHNQPPEKVMCAVKCLAPKWLERSKFYGAFQEDMDAVIVQVLRRISDHFTARCKKTMTEHYFGQFRELQVMLFDSAVFFDRQKPSNREYAVDEKCVYYCRSGLWSVRKLSCPPGSSPKLEELLKTVDSVMRQEYAYRYPVKCELDTKWILKIIREEIQTLQAEKKAAKAKKITIDYSRLAGIRQDAAVTRDKLMVEEEVEEGPEEIAPSEALSPQPVMSEDLPETPLSREEYRLLQCLLYGRDLGWVRSEGIILSVLADGINEKLYDIFSDLVLMPEDPPELIDDYIEELKEMVRP